MFVEKFPTEDYTLGVAPHRRGVTILTDDGHQHIHRVPLLMYLGWPTSLFSRISHVGRDNSTINYMGTKNAYYSAAEI